MCADHNSTPAILRNMTNYTNSEKRMNGAFCKAYSGRLLRHNAVVKPARHYVAWIRVNSRIMGLIFKEVHQKCTFDLDPKPMLME